MVLYKCDMCGKELENEVCGLYCMPRNNKSDEGFPPIVTHLCGDCAKKIADAFDYVRGK